MSHSNLKEAARNFSRRYPAMDDKDTRAQKGLKIARVLARALNGAEIEVLLDIGCSNAVVLDKIVAELEPQFAIGIDLDARTLPPPRSRRVTIVADAMALPFASRQVDVVVCNHTYEHVPDPHIMLREIHRVLKPGGIVYFSAMNARWPIEPHFHLPFIHWLPTRLSKAILRPLGHSGGYLEKPLGLGKLKRLVSDFDIVDYTLPIIESPITYGAEDVIPATRLAKLYPAMARAFYGLLPGYVWILRKRG